MTRFDCAKLIFDLDGTLVDTSADLTHALNHVLGLHDIPPVLASSVRAYVGHGARFLIAHALGKAGSTVNPDTLLPDFLDYYRAHIAVESRLFDGMADMLDWADDHGLALGICTNKSQALAEQLLEALEIKVRFSSILGGDALPVKKPDPVHLRAVIDTLPGSGPAVLIGDTETDVKTAKAAGCPVGVVAFGFSPKPAADLGADFLIHHAEALPRWLAPISRYA